MSSFFLVWRNLSAHPLRSFLTALAITLGVGMVLAGAIIGQAANERAISLASENKPQADLEVFARDNQPFSADALATIRAHDQVEVASASLKATAQISNPQSPIANYQLLGVDPSYPAIHKPGLADGTFLPDPNSILLPMSLAIRNNWRTGDEIELKAGDHAVTVKVSGRIKLPENAAAQLGPAQALVPLEVAQGLTDAPDQIDHVEIKLRSGADADKVRADLASRLGADFVVARAAVEGGPSFTALTLQALLALVGVIILFAAGFVIANAFGMAITARIKELGSLRTLGMTRRQILNTVLLEAGALGVVGAIGGVIVGVGIAWLTLWVMGFGTSLAVPWWGAVFSPIIGLVVTGLSALLPAWQASRISPMEAVRPESLAGPAQHGMCKIRLPVLTLFLLLITLGLFGFLARPDWLTAFAVLLPAMVVLLSVVAWLMPAFVGPVANFARPWLARFFGTAGRLAADNIQRNPVRAALTAGAMTAGLTMIIATSGLIAAAIKGGLVTFATLINEDRIVQFSLDDPSKFRWDNSVQAFVDAEPLDPELRARLQALADQGLIELQRIDMVNVPSELGAVPNYPGVFADPEPFIRHGDFDFFEGNPDEALRIIQRGPAILIAPTVAERLNVHVGDPLKVQTPKGEVDFTVAGIGGTFWVMAAFPYADGQAYFGVTDPPSLSVYVRGDQDRERVLKQVDAIVKDYPGVMAWNLKEGFGSFYKLIDQITVLLNALLLMAVVVAALGVVNTMVINVAERKREIGMLRAVGATQRQIRQSVMAEGATLGLFAVVVAVLVSFVILIAYLLLVGPNGVQSLGFRLTAQTFQNALLPALPVMGAATLVSLVAAPTIAALAAYYPARQAAAMDVIAATRSEPLTLQPPTTRRAEGEPERGLPRSLSLLLAQKSIEQQRTRVLLSIIAITLGATMTVAGDVLAKSIIGVVTRTEDLRAIGEGLWSQLDPMFKGIGAGIMLAAGFLIFNTFAMSITQRRQQIGALRSLGMTRGQVLRMVLAEALIIGGTGTLLGLILGPFLGQGIIAFMRSLDNPILNAFAPSQPSLISFILAAVMGLGITVLASLMPARQAMRLSPLVALKAPDLPGVERNPNRLGLAGFVLCSLLSLYLIVAPPAAWLQPPYDALGAVVASAVWIAGLALMLPALVGVTGSGLRPVLARGWGATGRLMADNLQRGRGRVLLTVVTLAISLAMIGALTGFIQFYLHEFFGPKFEALRQEGNWVVSAMNIEAGLAGYANMDSLRTPPAAQADLRAALGERGDLMPFTFVIVPELSFMGDTYFSFILDPPLLRKAGPLFMTFKEGDWDTAIPIMEQGCGLLVTPYIANKNHAGLGDSFVVNGPKGPVTCTIAGIGSTFVGASIISSAAQNSFDSGDPFSLFVQSRPGSDRVQLESDLKAAADRHGLHLLRMDRFTDTMLSVFDNVPVLFNAFLLMAVLAAALGVVNTTLLSVTERRREFGQLRALGATRAQVRAVVVGEAALMGFLGGLVGLVASVGLTVIFATVYGGSSGGVENYQPWAAAFRTLPKVLPTGLMGVLASPLICAVAAYLPANAILRGAAIETLKPEQQQPITRRRIAGLLSRGNLQTRFVLGTGVLLAVLLGGLIAVVTAHARDYLESRSRDAVGAMVTWNASMIELNLPAGAETLTLSNLQSGQFDAEGMLRFKALMDDLSANGLADFSIADRDNVTLFSLDTRNIGATAPPLDSTDKTVVRSERVEGDDTPQIVAVAPIQNNKGALVGSIRVTMRLDDLRAFLNRLRNTLWAFGVGILVVGLAVSWTLSRPFASATRQLAALVGRVAQGDYSPIPRPGGRRWPGANISIRTRLTIAMALLAAMLVGVLGLVVIPIERQQVERTVRDGMLTAAEFIGQALSASLAEGMPPAQSFNLQTALTAMPNLNLAKLREVSAQARSEDIAYMAVVNNDGVILLSDQVTLVGESAPTSAETKVEDAQWKGEDIWVASTPLRRGREGEQIGTLRLGVRRAGMEQFLDESRNLFWLAGLIAVLAGVLLAQGIGGAVTAPVQELVTGTRRVARGDLAVRFPLRAGSRDELAQLAGAYNEMVAGLRDRERVRDLFGRYVSREVSEAVLSGRVSLKGERKTITTLYVDMRGSTAFAEAHPPEEVMGALNQYFEVVILATETYGGIVNRFVGDEAVCVFGAPTAQPDHAAQAVQAALAMRAGLAYLNQKRAALGLPTLRFGIGLNTGEVVAGATGSEERQEYTVIGDAMNLGARIQELSKTFPEHGILLSEFTLAALGATAGDYEFVDLGAVEIRGKSQPVRVYGVEGRRI
jgi:putative ABC transport system permease protein